MLKVLLKLHHVTLCRHVKPKLVWLFEFALLHCTCTKHDILYLGKLVISRKTFNSVVTSRSLHREVAAYDTSILKSFQQTNEHELLYLTTS